VHSGTKHQHRGRAQTSQFSAADTTKITVRPRRQIGDSARGSQNQD